MTTMYDRRQRSLMLPRRLFLRLAAGAAAFPAVSWIAQAQTYPTRPVRIIVGFPAGGASDIFARLIGEWLSERLGQAFIIENRPGAATNIATEVVVKAAPDGHTLLLFSTSATINGALYEKLNFDFSRDIAPVAPLVRGTFVLVANPSMGAKTVPELIAYARTNPGKLNMGSAGVGTTQHLIGELFKTAAAIDMQHVPYRGEAPALIDLIANQIQLYFGALSGSIESIRAGKVRALAVTTATRAQALPDIPALGEFLPGFEASGWTGVGAPRSTSTAIVERLNAEINLGLATSRIRDRLVELGVVPFASTPAEFEQFIAAESEKWAKVIQDGNIKPQ